MVLKRALWGTTVGTALGLSLAGCAMDSASNSAAPTEIIAQTNQAAAASVGSHFSRISPAAGPNTGVQVASLDPMLARDDTQKPLTGQPVAELGANPPLVQKGTVLWRLSGDEADLPPTPKMGEELQRLRESLSEIKGQTSQQLTDIEGRLQTNQQTLAQVKDDQQRQERDLRSQTAEAVTSVASMAQENMRSMERVARNTSDRWYATTQQLNQLEGRLQTAIADVQQRQARADDKTQAYTDLKVSQASLETQLSAVREARQAAMEAELRAKAFTGQQLAGRDQLLGNLLTNTQANQQIMDTKLAAVQQVQGTQFAALSSQLAGSQLQTAAQLRSVQADMAQQVSASQQLTTSQMENLKTETALRLDTARQVQGAQLAAVSNQLATNQQLTALQIADLRKLNDENRALATSEITNVTAALRQYGDAQLQQASANTSATIASLAKATNQNFAMLSDQTNRRLGLMWQAANQNAEKLAEAKANAVAASVAALQQQTASERVTPEQIRSISEKTVADSTPEFRALALKTMQESQDYIRTIARGAVQDKDPAMKAALADAARDVITKDDKVVFAIRKAVADELQGLATDTPAGGGTVVPAVRLGPDRDRAISEAGTAVDLDPDRIRIAQLLAPGGTTPASDAALASISPAAGQAPQATTGAGGQQSWSTPTTSLLRARNRADWMDLRQYKVVVHEDDQTLEELLGKVLKRSEPFTGPWQIRWKISEANKDVMKEKFSLDAETTFEEFVSYLAQYMVNDRGVKLSFSLFDNERIIVVSD